MSDSANKFREMENQNQESAPGQPNQPLDSPSHELQSPSPNQQTQKRNHSESPQHESHHVPDQPPKRSRNANPQSFPQDIIVEILSNLLVKSLLRFRCVSKTWKALLTDPSFIKKHLKKPKYSKKRVLVNTSSPELTQCEYSIQSCFMKAIFEVPIVNTQEIEYPSKIDYRCDRIVGSCNGLVCIVTGQDTVFLINPSLRVFKSLPDLGFKRRERYYNVIGFGFDASMDDYKVVRVFCYQSKGFGGSYETIVWVYSLRTNYWRRIQNFPFGVPCRGVGKYVDGCLNWVVSHRQDMGSSCIIVSLDLAHETYEEVMQPCYGNGVGKYRTLGVLDGRLCAVCNYGRLYAEVWVMKEYGKKESWSKLVTVPYTQFPECGWFSAPLFVSESGEILLHFGSDLIIYNPKEKLCRKPVIANAAVSYVNAAISYIEQVEVFEESLVSPIVGGS